MQAAGLGQGGGDLVGDVLDPRGEVVRGIARFTNPRTAGVPGFICVLSVGHMAVRQLPNKAAFGALSPATGACSCVAGAVRHWAHLPACVRRLAGPWDRRTLFGSGMQPSVGVVMRLRSVVGVVAVAFAMVAAGGVPGSVAATNPDTRVSVGSPPMPFSQNKQNEPALAVDAQPPVGAGGRRERRDRHGGVQRRRGQHVPVHPRRRGLRVYFSFDCGRDLDPADVHRADRPRLPRRPSDRATRAVRPLRARSGRCRGTTRTGWSPTATRRWRSAPGLAPAASAGPTGRGCTTPT